MKIVTLYDRDSGKIGKALDFWNRVRIGGWNAFPLRKPIAFRSSENLKTKGWQLDVLFFSVAVKYAERQEQDPSGREFREKVVAVCFVGMVVIALLAAFGPEWMK